LVKKLIVFIFFALSLYGATLNDTIRGLVDERHYERHKLLIDLLFQKEEEFYIGDRVDVVKVARVLKENGLLELFYDEPTMTYIKFVSNSKPTLFLKIINDILQQMGFTYYFIDSVEYSEGKIEWAISYLGDYAIDPHTLALRLQAHKAVISSITKEAHNSFEYVINMHGAYLDAPQLIPGRSFEIRRAVDDIMLDVSLGTSVVLQPLPGSLWYPEIVLYDKNLNIINVITEDTIRRNLNINLTAQTHYISISDLYQLENLNGGLRVKLRGER